MLVMISQPMNGRTNLDIKNERAEVIEKFNKLHIAVLDTVFEEEAPENCVSKTLSSNKSPFLSFPDSAGRRSLPDEPSEVAKKPQLGAFK